LAIKKYGTAQITKIMALEKKYNLSLPRDYIDFLLNYNGGLVEKDDNCMVYVRDLHDSINVNVLFGIDTGHENANIAMWMEMFSYDMLDGMLIIGDSLESGFIVLSCMEGLSGVYFWDHTYAFESSNDESNTYFITNTFTDFIKNIV
jgi:hypothetical protein